MFSLVLVKIYVHAFKIACNRIFWYIVGVRGRKKRKLGKFLIFTYRPRKRRKNSSYPLCWRAAVVPPWALSKLLYTDSDSYEIHSHWKFSHHKFTYLQICCFPLSHKNYQSLELTLIYSVLSECIIYESTLEIF